MRTTSNGGASRCLRCSVFAVGAWLVTALGCGGGDDTVDPDQPQRFELGPFELAPNQEDYGTCVSVELHNAEPMFINAVELETATGFHHSNWFYVPHDT